MFIRRSTDWKAEGKSDEWRPFDPSLLKAGLGFKQAKQTVVDAFEIAYLQALMLRNEGNITRSAQEAGLTRYHLRELLKRHGLKGGDQE